jgi:hypothetical protein
MLELEFDVRVVAFCKDCGTLAGLPGLQMCTRCSRITEHLAHGSPERLCFAKYLIRIGRIGEDVPTWPVPADPWTAGDPTDARAASWDDINPGRPARGTVTWDPSGTPVGRQR